MHDVKERCRAFSRLCAWLLRFGANISASSPTFLKIRHRSWCGTECVMVMIGCIVCRKSSNAVGHSGLVPVPDSPAALQELPHWLLACHVSAPLLHPLLRHHSTSAKTRWDLPNRMRFDFKVALWAKRYTRMRGRHQKLRVARSFKSCCGVLILCRRTWFHSQDFSLKE